MTSDGSGGAIITWTDYRYFYPNGPILVYAQKINSIGIIQWTPNGIQICTNPSDQLFPKIAGDGNGGAIIVWEDDRNNGLYIQHIDASGITQWSPNGVQFTISHGGTAKILGDGNGGAIVAWQASPGGLYTDIYAQRIDSKGVLLWPAGGVAICSASLDQHALDMVTDGKGGAIITWVDDRNNYGVYDFSDIYAQRVNLDGLVQWTKDGVAISIATYGQSNPALVTDGNGGAIITWLDSKNGLYAQKINAVGIVQWADNGVMISSNESGQSVPAIVSDGRGNAIITWEDNRNGYNNTDVYAQKINNNGKFPVLTVLTPKGGEKLAAGNTYKISWSAPLSAVKFNISLSTNSGATWKTIAINRTGTSYFWKIPAQIANRPKCRIKVAGYDSKGLLVDATISDYDFEIYVIRVIAPNGKTAWISGSVHAVKWATGLTSKTLSQVSLYYTLGNGYKLITSYNGTNPGSYNWTVPAVVTKKTACRVKIVLAFTDSTSQAYDISDFPFTIVPAL